MAEILGSFTREKSDVSYIQRAWLEVIFSDKSLIYTKKNRGPKIDPCGTPVFTANQFDDYPFSITHWNLLLRKLLVSVGASPEMRTCLSL